MSLVCYVMFSTFVSTVNIGMNYANASQKSQIKGRGYWRGIQEQWERGDSFTKGFCVEKPFAYFIFVSLVIWLITYSLFILPKGAKDGKITFMSTQSGIFGKVNCWMPGGILHLRREWHLNETGLFFFPVTFKWLLSCSQWTYESFPAFSILAPEGCIVHWESSDLYQCTKTPLPCWSYQLSFSKRPEETRGDQGRRSQSVSDGSLACKPATLLMLKTRFIIQYCTQNSMSASLHPTCTCPPTHECIKRFWAFKQKCTV